MLKATMPERDLVGLEAARQHLLEPADYLRRLALRCRTQPSGTGHGPMPHGPSVMIAQGEPARCRLRAGDDRAALAARSRHQCSDSLLFP